MRDILITSGEGINPSLPQTITKAQMKTFQVIQNPAWSCPGMLIFVDNNNNIIGQQANPNNALTQDWADDGDNWGQFDPANFQSVTQL